MKLKILLIAILLSQNFIAFSQTHVNKTGEKAADIVVQQWLNQQNSSLKPPDSIAISDLRGKTIILDFWFTKCAPCVASIPHLNGLVRMYPEVVFLSFTFDSKEIVDEFLDKKMMHYPVGIDTERKTIRAYEVSLYPETFIIDSSGIIRWQGSSFNLENEQIDKVLGIPIGSRNLQADKIEGKENKAFHFTIEENKLGMQGNSTNYSAYKINVFNYTLKSILKLFFDISHARIINQDTILTNKTYNIEIEADKKQTEKYEVNSFLQSQLPRELNFKIIPFTKDTTVHLIRLADENKLKKYSSKNKVQVYHLYETKWVGEGVSFTGLKKLIENEYELPAAIEDETYELLYDYNLPINDFEAFKETLLDKYGIEIVSSQKEITFFEIIGK